MNEHLSEISVYTTLLSYYKECTNDMVAVDLHAFGCINEMLRNRALDALEELEDFLPLWKAEATLDEGEKS